jgi:hypothetical protein
VPFRRPIGKSLGKSTAAVILCKPSHLQAFRDAGGGTRTPDTRIMIARAFRGCSPESLGFSRSLDTPLDTVAPSRPPAAARWRDQASGLDERWWPTVAGQRAYFALPRPPPTRSGRCPRISGLFAIGDGALYNLPLASYEFVCSSVRGGRVRAIHTLVGHQAGGAGPVIIGSRDEGISVGLTG